MSSRIDSVGNWCALHNVPVSTSVTCSRMELQATENALLDNFTGQDSMDIRLDGYTYKRYGYALSDAVAANYAADFEAPAVGFKARLVNSGMAAIDTALRVALSRSATPRNSWLCHGGQLYPETLTLISEYGRLTGCRLVSIDETDSIEMIDAHSRKSRLKGDVYFFETIANHPRMTPLCTEKVLRLLWKDRVTLILDNTITSAMNLDIVRMFNVLKGELGEPTCTVVIVESLTKYYRADSDDPVTAGLIMAPADFIAECDSAISRTGAYLQYMSLERLPWSATDALERTVVPSSRNAQVVAAFLSVHDLVEIVSYPSAQQFPNGVGAVLFFAPKAPADERISDGMVQSFGSMMGSFGHPKTTWVPWGARVPGDYPASTIRLACGWADTAAMIRYRLDSALRLATEIA